jgi:uncharacterized protein YndB with AHSA1/START domain
MSERQQTAPPVLDPVVVTVTVPCEAALAFGVFTEGLGSWWPLAGFSLGADRITAVEVEGRVGGHIEEVWDDGTRRQWAEVLVWDPPRGLALAWNPGGYEVGREPTRVDVTFTEEGAGSTSVRLVHTGWEAWGAQAQETRSGYDGGWVEVLGGYVARLGG